jgi:hypothetical protein
MYTRVLPVVLAVSLPGCAGKLPEIRLASTLAQASDNELAVTSELRVGSFFVTGIVEKTGLKNQREAEAKGSADGFGNWSTHARVARGQYPYAILAPEDAINEKAGRALCFFEIDDVEAVSRLEVGKLLRVKARLQEFIHKGDQEVMVLACAILEK